LPAPAPAPGTSCCCWCPQVISDTATQKFLATRAADQQRALAALRADPGLSGLQLIEGPLLDLEVRGAAALAYFGGIVWK
jgi:arsenite-transporting ATPase